MCVFVCVCVGVHLGHTQGVRGRALPKKDGDKRDKRRAEDKQDEVQARKTQPVDDPL